jgi:hypothetical protein
MVQDDGKVVDKAELEDTRNRLPERYSGWFISTQGWLAK